MTSYLDIFKDRTILVTGCARSGTTILGKLLASLRPAYYLYEPNILRFPTVDLLTFANAERFRQIVFEDMFMPAIRGFGNNYSYNDHIEFYRTDEEIRWANENLDSGWKAREFCLKSKPYFIIKQPDTQPYLSEWDAIFPGIRIFNIIRNGVNVIKSMLNLKWEQSTVRLDFNDTNIIWPNPYQWGLGAGGCPVWLPEDSFERSRWNEWNRETRLACLWRMLNEYTDKYKDNPDFKTVKYEDLVAYPEKFIEKTIESLKLTPSALTMKHIEGIRYHPGPGYNVTMGDISQPELGKFVELLTRLDYLKIPDIAYQHVVNNDNSEEMTNEIIKKVQT